MDTQTNEQLISYVLGLLDQDERSQVEMLVARDQAARAEVLALQQSIHQLALTAPVVRPRPALKGQLLSRVAASKRAGSMPARREAPSRTTALMWALMLALIVSFGGWNIMLRSENATLRSENTQLAQILSNERLAGRQLAQTVTNRDEAMTLLVSSRSTSRELLGTLTAPTASGTMYMEPGNPVAVVVVKGLAPLPEDQVYQFWLAREGEEPIPSNMFEVDEGGQARLVVEADEQVNNYKQVMITIEPRSGSSQPGATVLEGNL